jgi:hypothetical protein
MHPEERDFEVRDRRFKEKPDDDKAPSPKADSATPESRPSPEKKHRGPIRFSDFIFSLSTSALIQMGVEPDPRTNAPQLDLEQASELIDLISLLEEKTRGNLTPDETAFLSNILYMLRMKYVETVKQHPRQSEG